MSGVFVEDCATKAAIQRCNEVSSALCGAKGSRVGVVGYTHCCSALVNYDVSPTDLDNDTGFHVSAFTRTGSIHTVRTSALSLPHLCCLMCPRRQCIRGLA